MSEVVGETKDNSPYKSEDDFETLSKKKGLMDMKAEILLAVGTAKRKVHRTTVDQAIILDGHQAVEEGMLDPSYQLMKYVLTYVVAAGTLGLILGLNVD